MNRILILITAVCALILSQCKVIRDITETEAPVLSGMEGLVKKCEASDTVQSILISKAEALLTFDDERYEVVITLYAKRDSIIYLSAVNSGYEILRASVEKDSIRVINRLNKIVYRAPLQRRFGYQFPVNFKDLERILNTYNLCGDLPVVKDDPDGDLNFEFDEDLVKKRITIDHNNLNMRMFEFYHHRTNQYLMGEQMDRGFKIYSNFMIGEFEIVASGGEISYNRRMKVKMQVNPRRYTFTELR